VPHGALIIAITRCWASALQDPAIRYRQAHGMPIHRIGIAVLIQPMLFPASAGVGFTVDPVTGAADALVIEAIPGLGDRLVSGNVQPFYYRLANQPPDYPLLEQRPGDISTPAGSAGAGQVDPLTPADAARLALLLNQIQALMGEAQDVEWARIDDTFFVLQTRPLAATSLPRSQLNQEWGRASQFESLPELPSPFFGSLLERSQNQIMFHLKDLGLDLADLGPYEKLFLGRPYMNLTLFRRALAQVGINPEGYLQAMGYTKGGGARLAFSIDWRGAWQARRVYYAIFKQVRQVETRVKHSEALVDEVVNILASFDPAAPRELLLSQVRQQVRVFSSLTTNSLSLRSSIGLVMGLCSRILAPVSASPTSLSRLLALKDVRTSQVELNEALLELAHVVRNSEELVRIFGSMENESEDTVALASTNSPAFKQSFGKLLTTFGDRADYETDPGYPRYGEDQTVLLRIMRQYAKDEPTWEANAPAATWQAMTTPPSGLDRFFPWRRWLAWPFILWLRRLFVIRDKFDSVRAKAMAACRRWDLALGQIWADRGWLDSPQDIFWLTLAEIEQAIMQDRSTVVALPATVQARKETYQGYAGTEMPASLKDSQLSSIQVGAGLSAASPSDVVVGLPISPGQIRGTIVVMLQPTGFEAQGNDNIILVMPSTDPAWLAQLSLASGLIVEKGGLLSHGSIIAREYGLPAVANVPHATQRFRTGEVVLIDGSTGVVQRLEPVAGDRTFG
jgi:pyruvate,water dikinase